LPRIGLSRRTALLLVAAALPALALTGTASAQPARVQLPTPNPGDLVGTITNVDPSLSVNLRVYYAGQPGRAAAALDVSDPHSPDYTHYLTPTQAQQRYGATPDQLATVNHWLTSQGMTVTATTPHYVAVTATATQVDAAFATQLKDYQVTTGGKGGGFTSHQVAATGGFSVPANLAADIASVTGIEQTEIPDATMASAKRAPQQAISAQPADYQCSQYWAQHSETIPAAYGHTTAPTQLCGYTPDQMRSAYGVTNSPYTGKGATVAVVLDGHWPTELADANRFFADHGEAGFAPGQYTEVIDPSVDPSCTATDNPVGDGLEESLDVETTHIAAPDAHIVYVAADCSATVGDYLAHWLDGITTVVDGHLADVVTGSWGWQEAFLSRADTVAWDLTAEQAAIEGIGLNFSTGDAGDIGFDGGTDGSQTMNPRFTQFPATDPWSTGVGGTSVAIGANGTVVADYPWGDNATEINAAGTGYDPAPPGQFLSGSGGGVSTLFPEPGYQQHVVPAAVSTQNGTGPAARTIPDISANSGNLWYIGFTGAVTDGQYDEILEGGTSGSTPLLAGLEADAEQATGHALGFINPALYDLCGSTAIRDILPVDPADPPAVIGTQEYFGENTDYLTTFGEDATLTATGGYDDATGLGAPTPSFVTSFRRF
jgi:subtilase family serine protease